MTVGWIALLQLPAAPLTGQVADSPASPVPQPAAAGADPLVAVEIVSPPSGLRVLRLPMGESPLVSLRLFVPLQEGPAEAGAGWILAQLSRERISEAARRLGAEFMVTRTPEGIAYAVAGPLSDFDYLSYLLRIATQEPSADRVSAVRLELEDAVGRLTETGSGQTEFGLRMRLGTPPIWGTPESVQYLSPALVRDLWSRSHRADQMTLLVLGDVDRPLLLASTVELGSSDSAPPPSFNAPAGLSDLPRIDILRRHGGRAWQSPETLDPRMAVLARLAGELVRGEPGDFEATVQLWEHTGGSVLAVTGAAFPALFPQLERAIDGLPTRAGATLTQGAVAEVSHALGGGLLAQADTPMGRVQVVGRFMDAWGTPDAARRYLERLEAMQVADVLALVELLGAPASVTVR